MPSEKNVYLTRYLHAGWRLVLPSKFAPISRGSGSIQYNTRKHIVLAQLVSLLLGKDPQGSYLAGNYALGPQVLGKLRYQEKDTIVQAEMPTLPVTYCPQQ